jgi:hypothetical protein
MMHKFHLHTRMYSNCSGLQHTLSNCSYRNRGSSVGIVTAYELDDWGSIHGRGKRFSSTPQRPDRLWVIPIEEVMRALFHGAKAA